MININELRRLAQAAALGPDGVSLNWLKLLQDFQKEANPAVITEILDRLEAAESDALEQARLNGMGASREAALMAKLEAAEKDIAHIKEVEFPRKVRAVAVGWEKKCARLEQERDALRAPTEQDTSVRKAWARFSNELHRGPDAPYPGMAEGFEQHFSQSFTDREWRAESATWAAAWKAAKRHEAQQAQPVPSMSEGWKPVPTAESRHPGIYKMLGALHTVDNTPGASEWESYAAFLAAAPEAKP